MMGPDNSLLAVRLQRSPLARLVARDCLFISAPTCDAASADPEASSALQPTVPVASPPPATTTQAAAAITTTANTTADTTPATFVGDLAGGPLAPAVGLQVGSPSAARNPDGARISDLDQIVLVERSPTPTLSVRQGLSAGGDLVETEPAKPSEPVFTSASDLQPSAPPLVAAELPGSALLAAAVQLQDTEGADPQQQATALRPLAVEFEAAAAALPGPKRLAQQAPSEGSVDWQQATSRESVADGRCLAAGASSAPSLVVGQQDQVEDLSAVEALTAKATATSDLGSLDAAAGDHNAATVAVASAAALAAAGAAHVALTVGISEHWHGDVAGLAAGVRRDVARAAGLTLDAVRVWGVEVSPRQPSELKAAKEGEVEALLRMTLRGDEGRGGMAVVLQLKRQLQDLGSELCNGEFTRGALGLRVLPDSSPPSPPPSPASESDTEGQASASTAIAVAASAVDELRSDVVADSGSSLGEKRMQDTVVLVESPFIEEHVSTEGVNLASPRLIASSGVATPQATFGAAEAGPSERYISAFPNNSVATTMEAGPEVAAVKKSAIACQPEALVNAAAKVEDDVKVEGLDQATLAALLASTRLVSMPAGAASAGLQAGHSDREAFVTGSEAAATTTTATVPLGINPLGLHPAILDALRRGDPRPVYLSGGRDAAAASSSSTATPWSQRAAETAGQWHSASPPLGWPSKPYQAWEDPYRLATSWPTHPHAAVPLPPPPPPMKSTVTRPRRGDPRPWREPGIAAAATYPVGGVGTRGGGTTRFTTWPGRLPAAATASYPLHGPLAALHASPPPPPPPSPPPPQVLPNAGVARGSPTAMWGSITGGDGGSAETGAAAAVGRQSVDGEGRGGPGAVSGLWGDGRQGASARAGNPYVRWGPPGSGAQWSGPRE